MSNLIGQSLGRYHILEQLGEGGMATVYKAYDTRLERDVAVKVIRVGQFGQDVIDGLLKRFEREAKALARLTHPNIVHINDYGEYEGVPYLVMDYLPGGTLKERMRLPMAWPAAARLLLLVLSALEYAHEHKIIHRDVKPANILLTEKGQPMLTDFGIAKLLETEAGQTLTGTGVGIGTPEYMAPEQGLGKPVDGRADLYALGVIFYELVAGRKPYTADTPMAVVFKHISDPLPDPRQFAPNLPESVARILFKALAKAPEDRYPDAQAFADALEKLLQAPESPANRAAELPASVSQTVDWKLADTPSLNRPVPHHTAVPDKPAPAWNRINVRWIGLGLGALLLVVALLGWLGTGGASRPSLTPTFTVTSTSAPSLTLVATATPTPGIGSTTTSEKDGMTLVFVPQGPFTMGSDNAQDSEKPAHTVTLDAFWIDQTEVTDAMFAVFAQTTNYKTDVEKAGSSYAFNTSTKNWEQVNGANWQHPQGPNSSLSNLSQHPVAHISWNDANAYCAWAGR